MSLLRRVVDKAVRLTALAGIGYLLVSIVVTFVTRWVIPLVISLVISSVREVCKKKALLVGLVY